MSEMVPKVRFQGFTDDWEQRKLGEVTTRVRGNNEQMNLPTLTMSAGSGWLDQKDRFSGDISGKEKKNYTLLSKGELSYNHGNSKLAKYGVVFVLRNYDEALVPRVYHSFKTNKEAFGDFIEYMFATKLPDRELAKLVSSGARMDGLLNINYDDFMSINITIPSISEQKQISSLFRQLDNLITLHQRKLDLLKEQKKGFLQKMFPKDGQLVPEVRFAGFTDDWEQRKLGELASNFEYGLNASAKEFDGIHKYIRITDIDDSSRKFNSDSITSPDIDLSSADNYKLKNGDLLFARTGASVGKSYLYTESDGLVYYAGFLIRARLKSEFDSNFVFQNTLTNDYNNFIKVTSQRSGQPGVNAQEYASFNIKTPCYDEQQKIGLFFKQLDDLITLHQRKVDFLKEQKKGYLQKMFVS
ncbi:restriction endonuclease subunit S [Leuconostoc lactis]|nr:restriction endonuclease subunit S [Leuconostoc lactis]QEA51602.1 restriction endonuclease subunit S [Leuconostoc lactis]